MSEKISLDAKSKTRQINEDANARIEAIEKDTVKKIEKLRKENTEKIEKEKENILEAAKIEGESLVKRIINAKENEILQDALKSIEDNVEEFKKQTLYKKLLGTLSSECIEELGKDAKIYVNKEDLPLLSKKINTKASDEKMMGGVFAVSADNKKVIDYSLESIIMSLKDDISKKLIDYIEGK